MSVRIVVTKKTFERAVGCKPVNDDMERVNCRRAGEPGHKQCGWCLEHGKPLFWCFTEHRKG